MDVARQVLAVTVVFALLGAAVWTLRRGATQPRAIGGAGWLQVAAASLFKSSGFKIAALKSPGTAMERVGRLALTPQHTLHLVRIQGRDMIVATHPQGCSVVQPSPTANPAPNGVTMQATGEANA
jgi:hypothetical protein